MNVLYSNTNGAKPGIYGLSFSMGNQFSTDYSGTVGPIEKVFSADSDAKFDCDLMLNQGGRSFAGARGASAEKFGLRRKF